MTVAILYFFANKMVSKPMITAFLESYKTYSEGKTIDYENDSCAFFYVTEEFIEPYVEEHINTTEKMQAIIVEYGFKKLIDEMIELHGEEVCEDLFQSMDQNNFDNMWKVWIHNMLQNVCASNKH